MPRKGASMKALVGCGVLALVTERLPSSLGVGRGAKQLLTAKTYDVTEHFTRS